MSQIERPNTAVPAEDGEAPAPDPDHAWKTLALVNGWIRHSDSKAAVTLAFTGALGAMAFNLVHGIEVRSAVFNSLAVVASALLVLTIGLCGWTLTPRTRDKDASADSGSHLFFVSIARNFAGKRRKYRQALRVLASDPYRLMDDLADQIHANAAIAALKATLAKWAIRSALAAGGAIAWLAILIGANSIGG